MPRAPPLPPPSPVPAGVADALERRYLRKVFFGFSRDREGKDLLEEVRGVRNVNWWVLGCGCCQCRAPPATSQGPLLPSAPTSRSAPTRNIQLLTCFQLALPPAPQYVFSFSYDQGGNVHMAAGGSKQTFSTKDPAPSKSKVGAGRVGRGRSCVRCLPRCWRTHLPLLLLLLTTATAFLAWHVLQGHSLTGVKWQVLRLMRMLVEITNTLEQVGAALPPAACAALHLAAMPAMMWVLACQHPPAPPHTDVNRSAVHLPLLPPFCRCCCCHCTLRRCPVSATSS